MEVMLVLGSCGQFLQQRQQRRSIVPLSQHSRNISSVTKVACPARERRLLPLLLYEAHHHHCLTLSLALCYLHHSCRRAVSRRAAFSAVVLPLLDKF